MFKLIFLSIIIITIYKLFKRYYYRDGSSFIVLLDALGDSSFRVSHQLNFLLVYRNKKKVEPTNTIALIREMDTCIDSVKVETNSTYNIRIRYKANIKNFNEVANSFLPGIKGIIGGQEMTNKNKGER